MLRKLGIDPASEAIVTMSELMELITQFLYLYHITHHSGIDAVPLQKWSTSMAVHGRDMVLDTRLIDVVTGITAHDKRVTAGGGVRMFGMVWKGPGLAAAIGKLAAREPHRNRFWSTILAKYGDGFAASKDEEGLRRSTYDAFERHGTKLLIIDEVQHAGYRAKGSSAPTDVIKRFISDAQVGVGLFSNEDALTLLQSNKQLSHCLQEPCDIVPLDLTDVTAQARVAKFVCGYDDALVARKLFKASPRLRDPRTVECLMAISSGFLGRIVTLLQIAGRRAFLRGASSIELCDLSHACTKWAVAQGLTPHDPFRFGVAKGGRSNG